MHDKLKKISKIIDRSVSKKILTDLSNGKMVRPIFTLLCAQLTNNNDKRLMFACAALELVHNASLIHDDIIDDAQVRRGNRSLNKKLGKKMGTLIGDYVWCCAMDLLLKYNDTRIYEAFSKTIKKMVQGELLESSIKDTNRIDEKKYIRIIDLKTASLFELCATIPLLVNGSNKNEKTFRSLTALGRSFGRAFQIRDDLEDIKGDEKFLPNKKILLKHLSVSIKNFQTTLKIFQESDERKALMRLTNSVSTSQAFSQNIINDPVSL